MNSQHKEHHDCHSPTWRPTVVKYCYNYMILNVFFSPFSPLQYFAQPVRPSIHYHGMQAQFQALTFPNCTNFCTLLMHNRCQTMDYTIDVIQSPLQPVSNRSQWRDPGANADLWLGMGVSHDQKAYFNWKHAHSFGTCTHTCPAQPPKGHVLCHKW